MRRFIPVWLCVAVLAFGAAPALAAPLLLSPSDYDPKALLPPPPPEGSAAAKAELAELDRIQSQRTPEDFARADHDFHTRDASHLRGASSARLSIWPSCRSRPVCSKAYIPKKTPPPRSPRIISAAPGPGSSIPALNSCSKADAPQSSYPSGHSAMGYAMGVVLAALVPEKAPRDHGAGRRLSRKTGWSAACTAAATSRRARFWARWWRNCCCATRASARNFEAARAELRAAAIIKWHADTRRRFIGSGLVCIVPAGRLKGVLGHENRKAIGDDRRHCVLFGV